MELILIRHGKPTHTKNVDGTPADPPLSNIGEKQALKVKDKLSSFGVNKIYSSTLKRAKQTATPLAECSKLPLNLSEHLVEFDHLFQEYVPMETLKKQNYQKWLAYMQGDVEGVDFEKFSQKVIAAIEDIIKENKGQKVAIFCHGGVINMWMAHVMQAKPKLYFAPHYTSINRFAASQKGHRTVLSLNDVNHLDGLASE